jgi:enterobacteria phage integrase
MTKLPFLNVYKDRHGTTRARVRVNGKAVQLTETIGTPEFMRAYRAALFQLKTAAPAVVEDENAERTLKALIIRYQQTAEYHNLKASTKAVYYSALGSVVTAHGHRLVADLPRDKARKIIEEMGARTPGLANIALSVLQVMFNLAVNIGWRDTNPFAHMSRYKLGTHHTWTDAELAAYEHRWPVGTRERLAYDLLLYTAQRVGDVARMRLVDLVADHEIGGEMIKLTQQKTGTPLFIPVHPALAASLAAVPRSGLSLIGDTRGRPMKMQALRDLVSRAAADAGLPSTCVPHGLRKAACRRLAEAGCTVKAIAAISGHKTLSEVQRYTDAADQLKLARIALRALSDRSRAKVTNVTNFRLSD